jgi:hypothetical protein
VLAALDVAGSQNRPDHQEDGCFDLESPCAIACVFATGVTV